MYAFSSFENLPLCVPKTSSLLITWPNRRERGAPTSADRVAAEGARSCPAHEQRCPPRTRIHGGLEQRVIKTFMSVGDKSHPPNFARLLRAGHDRPCHHRAAEQ